MDVGGVLEAAEERAVGAGDDGDLLASEGDQGAGVAQCVVQADIAAGDGDEADVQRRVAEGEEEGDGVVGAGVAVDCDRQGGMIFRAMMLPACAGMVRR